MIRKATNTDIESVLLVTKACARNMISKGIYQWNENYPNAEAFEEDIKRNELFVLTQGNIVIGTIVISSFMDAVYQSILWETPNKRNVYIHRLAVHPEYQGCGFAQQLMDFAENFGRENGSISIRLDTFSQNNRNQKFYELRGYKRLGSIHYPNKSEHPFYCYELIL